MKKQIKFLLTIITIVVLTCGCNNTDNSNTLKVGMEAGYPPFNWSQINNSNGAVKIEGSNEYAAGYDVEIAKRLAKELNKELVIVKTEWDGLVPAVLSGKIDLIIAGMSPTDKRKEKIDFSDTYYTSDLVILVKKNSPYVTAKCLSDFGGAKITAQLNTFHYSVIDQIKNVNKVTAMENFSAMRVALESGMIDGYITEKPEAISAVSANNKFTFVEFEKGFSVSKEDTSIAIGTKKGNTLTIKINEILKKISEKDRENIMNSCIENQPQNN